ncbi:hypothetical protein VNI00_000511 [Paramarasmius palmivorus]|uniref:F-box domain-containing protein n=1 Tax=Paramarasmius palmivorus TaxID=297713 RepID=A0AAW0E9M4_9AGAR
MQDTRSQFCLPPEIVREIVAWSTDHSDLCSYCLVSRTWRGAALPFLFRNIKVIEQHDMIRWHHILTVSPEITKCIRKFSFQTSYQKYTMPPALALVSLPTMAGVVELEWIAPQDYPLKMIPAIVDFLRTFPNLRRVSVSGAFSDVKTFEYFLANCGPIRELSLKDPLLFKFGWDEESPSSKKLDVSQLDLSGLESLEVAAENFSLFDWVLILFRHSKPVKIRSFMIESIAFSTSTNLLPLPTSFPILPNLQKLELAVIHLGGRFHPERILCWAEDFFRLLDAPGLQVFELYWYAGEPEEVEEILESYDWKGFCGVLLERFPKVQELVLHIGQEMNFGRTWREKLEQTVVKHIPASLLDGRRITQKWTVENENWGSYSDYDSNDGSGAFSDSEDVETIGPFHVTSYHFAPPSLFLPF